MDLTRLNQLTLNDAQKELSQCCGSTRWAAAVAEDRPYESLDQLLKRASEVWWALDKENWLEAFRSHPKIGERKAAGAVSPQSQQWSAQEQKGVQQASQDVSEKLATLNTAYEKKFGFIFIVCATGKSTDEILSLLEQRLRNDVDEELQIAAAEQAKITDLRLRKLLQDS